MHHTDSDADWLPSASARAHATMKYTIIILSRDSAAAHSKPSYTFTQIGLNL